MFLTDLVTYDAIAYLTRDVVLTFWSGYRFLDMKGERRLFDDVNSQQIDGYLFVSDMHDYSDIRVFKIWFEMNGDIYQWEEI